MATEIELKLALSPKAARILLRHPLLAGYVPQHHRLISTYYDTADLALKSRHIGVRFRKKGWQCIQTVKSAEPASGGLAQRSEWECPATPGKFNFAEIDNKGLRVALESLVHDLHPIFTTDFKRTAWTIPFGDSEIELALDRGHIESNGRQAALHEVELELLTGYVGDLFALARQLQGQLDLHPTLPSKAERGYALYSDCGQIPFKAPSIALSPEMEPVDAFRQIALGCLEHLQRNEVGATANENPEFIHQARVALRRLRSAIRLFAPVLPVDFVTAYSHAWKTLAAALGEARDWDVFVNETLPPFLAAFPDDKPGKRLLKESRRQAHKAHRAVRKLLAVPEYSRLLVEFTSALLCLHDHTNRSLTAFSRQCLKKRAKAAYRLAQRHTSLGPAERHQMRISFKKLRYAVDFLSPLLPQRKALAYSTHLAKIQDALGLINDHITAEALLAGPLRAHHSNLIRSWIAGRHGLLIGSLANTLDAWMLEQSKGGKTRQPY